MTALRGAVTPVTRAPAARRPAGVASMIALQRSVGNGSTTSLLRRAHQAAEEPPVNVTLPGVVDHAAVSSWSVEGGGRHSPTSVCITRRTDADSPKLMQAVTTGFPDATAILVVRKLTPRGWVTTMTVRLEHCMVSSYQPQGEYESVHLTFSRMEVDQ